MDTRLWKADLGNGYYQNPILPGDYSDPDVIRVGEDYFMVTSSFCNVPGLPLLHSKDLVSWRVVHYILPQLPARYAEALHGQGVWAPSIRFREGFFYVYFPMMDEGIYMTYTKNPVGKWEKPVLLRAGGDRIDPCPFWDEDGSAYLVMAGVTNSGGSRLHMMRMSPEGTFVYGKERVIFDGRENGQYTIEGPKVYKRDGWYYIFAPAGGVKTGWQTVLRSKSIWGPYDFRVVMRQGSTETNGPHQGAWVTTQSGEDWFLHFQDT